MNHPEPIPIPPSTTNGPRIIRVGHTIPNQNSMNTMVSQTSVSSVPSQRTHTASSSLFEIDSLAVSGSTVSTRNTITTTNNTQSFVPSQFYHNKNNNYDYHEKTQRPHVHTFTDTNDDNNDQDNEGYATSSTENESIDDPAYQRHNNNGNSIAEVRPLPRLPSVQTSVSSVTRQNKWTKPITTIPPPPPSAAAASSSSNVIYVSPPRSTIRSIVSQQTSPSSVPVPSSSSLVGSNHIPPSEDEEETAWQPTLDHVPSSLFDSLDLSMSLPQRKTLIHRQSMQKQNHVTNSNINRRTSKDRFQQARQMDMDLGYTNTNDDENNTANAPNTSVLIRQHESINSMLKDMMAIPINNPDSSVPTSGSVINHNNANTNASSRIPSLNGRSRSVPRQSNGTTTESNSSSSSIPSMNIRATINPSPIQVMDSNNNSFNGNVVPPASPTRKISGNVPLRPAAIRNKDIPTNPFTSSHPSHNYNGSMNTETNSVATAPARAITTNNNSNVISPGIAINHPKQLNNNSLIPAVGGGGPTTKPKPSPGSVNSFALLPPKPMISPSAVQSPTLNENTNNNVPVGGRPPPRFISSTSSEAAFSVQSAQPRLLTGANGNNISKDNNSRVRSRSPAVMNNNAIKKENADTLSVAETDPGQARDRSTSRYRSQSRPRERSQSASKENNNNNPSSRSQRSSSPTPTTVTTSTGLDNQGTTNIVHPAAWGKGLITPQDEIRRATLERRKEYQERLKQLRNQALERKQQEHQYQESQEGNNKNNEEDDGYSGKNKNIMISTPKLPTNSSSSSSNPSAQQQQQQQHRSPSPLKKSSPLVQIPASNNNPLNRYMSIPPPVSNSVTTATTTVPSTAVQTLPTPPSQHSNNTNTTTNRSSSHMNRNSSMNINKVSVSNVRDSLSLTEEENRLRASLARLDVHIQSKLQAIGMHHPSTGNNENEYETKNNSRNTRNASNSRANPVHTDNNGHQSLSSSLSHQPSKVPIRHGPALPDSVARIRTAVAVGGGILPPQLPVNNSNNGGSIDAPNSVSSLADVIARTKSIVAQARVPSTGGPPVNSSPSQPSNVYSPNIPVKNNSSSSYNHHHHQQQQQQQEIHNDPPRQVHFSPLLLQNNAPNNLSTTPSASTVLSKPTPPNHVYPKQQHTYGSDNYPRTDDTLDVSDFQDHYYKETSASTNSSPFRTHSSSSSSLTGRHQHNTKHPSTDNPLYTTMEIERAIDLMSDSFSYPSKSTVRGRQRTIQTANRYTNNTHENEVNYDEDDDYPMNAQRAGAYATTTSRANAANGTTVPNPQPPSRISSAPVNSTNSVNNHYPSMVRTSGLLPIKSNHNPNGTVGGGKVSVADLERITTLLGTQ